MRFWSTDWQISSSLIKSGRAVGIYQPTACPREGVAFRRITGDPLGQRVVLMWRPEAERSAGRLRGVFNDVYLDLVRAQHVYGEWWDEHPEAHPARAADRGLR